MHLPDNDTDPDSKPAWAFTLGSISESALKVLQQEDDQGLLANQESLSCGHA